MIDTYVSAATKSSLENFIESLPASSPRTPICPGIASSTASTDEYGNAIAAHAAIGDPALFYTCVRTDNEPVLPDGVTVVDATIGKQIVGVFE
jgi:hypothetical protein